MRRIAAILCSAAILAYYPGIAALGQEPEIAIPVGAGVSGSSLYGQEEGWTGGDAQAAGSGQETGGAQAEGNVQAAGNAQAAEAPADQNQAGGEEGASGSAEDSGIDLEAKAEITYDDFAKLQFQVGEIIKCEAVPKSKKLLCSQVKIGSQVRQILSGIKAYYSPEEMVGKKVMVVTNLKPAKLAGMVSEGMILCAEDAEGNLALMTPEKSMPAGAEIC